MQRISDKQDLSGEKIQDDTIFKLLEDNQSQNVSSQQNSKRSGSNTTRGQKRKLSESLIVAKLSETAKRLSTNEQNLFFLNNENQGSIQQQQESSTKIVSSTSKRKDNVNISNEVCLQIKENYNNSQNKNENEKEENNTEETENNNWMMLKGIESGAIRIRIDRNLLI